MAGKCVAGSLEMNADFGARLRQWRESQGLTQKQMAQVVGVALRTYARYELEGGAPKSHVLRTLSGMGFDVGWNVSADTPSEKEDRPVTIDLDLLAEVIALLEGWLERNHKQLEPRKKAEFIATAYDFCTEEEKQADVSAVDVAPRVVERFLRLVS